MKASFGFLRNMIAVLLVSAVFLVFGAGSAAALNNGAEPRTTMDDYYYSDTYGPTPTPTSGWTCTVNGQQTDCATAKKAVSGVLLVMMIIFFVFFGIVAIICFVIWLIMLIHAISNPIKDKALWIILMVFFGTLVSFIYYFVVKRPFDKQKKLAGASGDAPAAAAPAPVTVEDTDPKVAGPEVVAAPTAPQKPKETGMKADESTNKQK